MKAIILARVSTEEQLLEGQSIPAQLARAREYCERKNLIIKSEHTFDESSLKDHRKKFEKVTEEIKGSKEPVALVVETVDRLQRGFKESVMLDELRKHGKLELHFLRENLVIHQNSNSSEIQRWDLAVFVAKSYVLQISDNVKRTNELKRRNGEWNGAPRLGYINTINLKGNKDIIPDPERAHLIVKMFELYATGNFSMKTLREKIIEMGLRTKLGKKPSNSVIEYILKDTFYYGMAFSKKHGHYPHRYKPLISKELFDKCQDVRKGRKQNVIFKSRDYIFKGLIHCKQCGCLITPEVHKGKFIYYSCTNAKRTCKRTYIPEKQWSVPLFSDTVPKERSE